jgi:hypothetical protein
MLKRIEDEKLSQEQTFTLASNQFFSSDAQWMNDEKINGKAKDPRFAPHLGQTLKKHTMRI